MGAVQPASSITCFLGWTRTIYSEYADAQPITTVAEELDDVHTMVDHHISVRRCVILLLLFPGNFSGLGLSSMEGWRGGRDVSGVNVVGMPGARVFSISHGVHLPVCMWVFCDYCALVQGMGNKPHLFFAFFCESLRKYRDRIYIDVEINRCLHNRADWYYNEQ